MRVLLVNQYFPPDATNTAYLLAELAEDLDAAHDVRVLAGRPSYNAEAGEPPPAGVRVIRVRSTGFPRTTLAGRATNYLSFLCSALVRGMREDPPDVVISFSDPPIIGFIGALIAVRRRCRLVQVYMDIYPDVAERLGMIRSPRLAQAWRAANRWLRDRADRVVAIGDDMAGKLVAEGVAAGKIVTNPNWSGDAPPPGDVDAIRRAQGWEGRFVVMHAGNVGLAQGLDAVIDAAARLRDLDDVRVVFLGDGAARGRLEARVHEMGLGNVEFLPHVPKGEAFATMAAADLHLVSLVPGLKGCVVPSKTYGILAMGKPIVAAVDEGSEVDLVLRAARCGVRVEPEDAAALAAAIRELAQDPDLEAMGRRGRELFLAEYTRSRGTARYLDMLAELDPRRTARQAAVS